jgi:hypothetical protein
MKYNLEHYFRTIINITVSVLDIIHRPDMYLKYDTGECIGFPSSGGTLVWYYRDM